MTPNTIAGQGAEKPSITEPFPAGKKPRHKPNYQRITPLQHEVLRRLRDGGPSDLSDIPPWSRGKMIDRNLISSTPGQEAVYSATDLGLAAILDFELTGHRPKGFAVMDPERRRRIARAGQEASKASSKKGHRFKPGDPFMLACAKKGGEVSRRKKKNRPTMDARSTEGSRS